MRWHNGALEVKKDARRARNGLIWRVNIRSSCVAAPFVVYRRRCVCLSGELREVAIEDSRDFVRFRLVSKHSGGTEA